jgi:hypothetical protein
VRELSLTTYQLNCHSRASLENLLAYYFLGSYIVVELTRIVIELYYESFFSMRYSSTFHQSVRVVRQVAGRVAGRVTPCVEPLSDKALDESLEDSIRIGEILGAVSKLHGERVALQVTGGRSWSYRIECGVGRECTAVNSRM